MDLHEAIEQARHAERRDTLAEAVAVAEQVCRENQKSAEASAKNSVPQKMAQAGAATAAEIAEILQNRIGGAG